jgi:endonuclease YncB( thermonuclease family)
MRALNYALAVLLAGAVPAAAQDAAAVSGPAEVVDSDALHVGDKSVMLWGIESMERGQTCSIKREPWQCYAAAVRALETLAGAGEVSCQIRGKPDPYGRLLGVCTVAGVDLNEALVRKGFALAKRDETEDYVAAEEAAKAEHLGLWQGEFILPSAYRRSHAIRVDRP